MKKSKLFLVLPFLFVVTTFVFGQLTTCDQLDHVHVAVQPGNSFEKYRKVKTSLPVHFKYVFFNKKTTTDSWEKNWNKKMLKTLNNEFSGLFSFSNKGSDHLYFSDISPDLSYDIEEGHITVFVTDDMFFLNNPGVTGFARFPWAGPHKGRYIVVTLRRETEKEFMNTLVHEMGHYFGLLHTHSNEEMANRTIDEANYSGDFIEDTGADPGGIIYLHFANGRTPKATHLMKNCQWMGHGPQSTYSKKGISGYSFDGKASSIKPFPVRDRNGVTYKNIPTDNHMNYHGDSCNKKFTHQQKNRMYYFYDTVRKKELSPKTSTSWQKVLARLQSK